METIAILVPVILSFFILVMPQRIRYHYTLAVTCLAILATSFPAVNALLHPSALPLTFTPVNFLGAITFTIDSLSGFFILVTNFTVFTGLLYSKGYMKSYVGEKKPARFALHYFSYVWLHFSMLGVLMLRDGLAFLIVWELMAVSSFMLILFEAENRTTLKTAVDYLIQMHIGLVLLTIAFLIVESQTGLFGFDGLSGYFSGHSNLVLFLLFFGGFGIKAGFIPLHTWLPEAHPAAPSHVSGVMSGVMIKMGIYGIIRVLVDVRSDWYEIGLFLLIISAVSGIYGVIMAITQHDLKKLLAYHSIENIGIIGMGLGIGAMGIGLGNNWMIVAGFTGGILHVLNHSLFKSLLFFSSGSVYQAYHTRNIEKLGGVIHHMPHTAALFLTGALAICGLPPLNGFISEILIYIGLLKGLPSETVLQAIIMMLALIFLVLIGGLAIFCFTKAFGITFLGSQRSCTDHPVSECGSSMLAPQYLIVVMIVLIGFVPVAFVAPLSQVVQAQFNTSTELISGSVLPALSQITRLSYIFVLAGVGLLLLRFRLLRRRQVTRRPTWGCGYTAPTARQQYTATSFASNFTELAHPILHEETTFRKIDEEEVFPANRTFDVHVEDFFKILILKITGFFTLFLKKIARLQTGNIQHYILYAFIFILIIFMLLYLKVL